MTRICCSCGWFVFNPSYKRGVARHQPECNGIAVSFKAAKRALSVACDLEVIMASPERRMRALSARSR